MWPAVAGDEEPIDPTETGEADAPSVEAAPSEATFAADGWTCAGKSAEVSANCSLSHAAGIASPEGSSFGEDDLAHDVRAPAVRPAEKRRGVIHVGDRRSGAEIAPDPAGDGTRSTDW